MKSTLDLKDFNDWALVSAYYSIYHASLALCALRGFRVKDHNAALLVLIREFYNKGIERDEIETISRSSIEKEEVLHYIEAKGKRIRANYSTLVNFNGPDAEALRQKAIRFVNKARDIIEFSGKF